ncbi:MAG: molecular chaperone DnaK [Candidatus Aminicenantes bacterium]|nr:molecular chaperone DnaK [Candidatus Aminicenantes bacterium]MDH5386311.1 molecular chaperone DnaK [Candidatus Aminicenantes bacterium]
MGNVIGIDLGTTYSCVAYMEGKEPRVIPNFDGLLTTPSVVSITSSGERLIGNLALRQAFTNPTNTITAIKRLMGKKFDSEEVKETKLRIPYRLAEAPNGDLMVELGSEKISPPEISAMILEYLKRCAESYFGEEVKEAVVTVPAHFDDHQRQATKDAAKIAGLEVLRIINEPTAASLAYGLRTRENATIAVYDMGGGTFDITLMEINDGVFHVLATNGNTYLGGEDFDNRIVDWLAEEFKKEHEIDLSQDRLALQRVKEAAEKAKRELSFTMETEINLPFIYSSKSDSKHIQKILTRQKLEEITRDLIEKSFPFIEQALEDGKLEPEKLDEIILVGGQTRMPLIRSMIAEFFRKEPVERLNPDEIVAMGAAIQSGILGGKMTDLVLLLDVTPLSLGIEIENDQFIKIIEKNTTIPTKKTRAFTTVEHDQRRVRIHVLQGEEDRASENMSLARFDLVGVESAPAGVPQIDVTFEIDADGLVKVSAKDIATGRVQKIDVRASSGLTGEQIEKIIKREQTKE